KRKERAWKSAREERNGVRRWRDEDAASERSNRVRRFRPSCHQENMHRRHVADEGRSVVEKGETERRTRVGGEREGARERETPADARSRT
ncbi:hypothetical protein X777_09173, partial [Ooceraea biroi]